MAISKIFELEHLPKGYTTNNGLNGIINSGLVINRYTAQNTAYGLVGLRVEGSKLCLTHLNNETKTNITGNVYIRFAELIGGLNVQPNKVTIGFRGSRDKVLTSPPYLFALATSNNGALVQTQVGSGNLQPGSAGTYFEIEMDLVNRTFAVYTDGVMTTPTAPLAASVTRANFATCFWMIGLETTAGIETNAQVTDNTPIVSIWDVYVTTDTGAVDDQYRGRLGPISVRKLPIASFNNAPWDVTNGWDLVTTLNYPRDSAAAAPFIRSDVAKTPLALKLDTSAIKTGETVLGMGVFSTPFRDSSVGAVLNTSVKYNGNSLPLLSVTPSVLTPGADTDMGYITALPGGGALTKAKLAEIDLVFTPV